MTISDQQILDTLIWQDFEGLQDVIPKPSMNGSRYEFEAANVGEAVALAETLKTLGRYQYFRGQADASWSMTSTVSRCTPAGREAELEKVRAFWSWVRNSPEMVPYLQSDDQILAAIQHHGIAATPLLDLTREPPVAGWFATEDVGTAGYGAIYLLDHDRLSDFFRVMSGGGLRFRFLEVDVANLWRLQAQSGLFLEGNADLEQFWPVDRIVFRQTGACSPITRSEIYPDRESHLEQMIRLHAVLDERSRRFEALINDPKSPLRVYHVQAEPAAAPAESSPPSEIWAVGPDERWNAVDLSQADVTLALSTLESDGNAVVDLIERRRRCTDLLNVTVDGEVVPGRFQRLLDALWTGMRPYPYTAQEIARAVSALARFDGFFRQFNLNAGKGTFELAQAHLESPLEIEMGLFGGGSTRCCVSGARLLAAFTSAGRRLLSLPETATVEHMKAALIVAQGVRSGLFDEERFRCLLVDEIIPWQVLSKRDPTIYAASQIEVLGVP